MASNGESDSDHNGKFVVRSDSPDSQTVSSCLSNSSTSGCDSPSQSGILLNNVEIQPSFSSPMFNPQSLSSQNDMLSTTNQQELSMAELLQDLNLEQDDGETGNPECRQTLELHVSGACRLDERLRPLLRWNLSCFRADGHFLGRLGLHFKAKEVAMLARCLCAPLVSLRVGKIITNGSFLHPTATRGHLDMTMLPSSDLRLSFVEDGGASERLAMVTPSVLETPLQLEIIPSDSSGRSFVLKFPANRSIFFWQSEKSKTAGDELLRKMKDILERRPTLGQLTGIHESRLQSIASYLRTLFPAVSPAISTRTSESSIVPPASSSSLIPPTASCSWLPSSSPSSSEPETNARCSGVVSSGLTGQSLVGPSSGSSSSSGSVECFSFSAAGSPRLLRSSGELDKKLFAQRILGSLPQTLVPFPLLVSASASAALIPALSPTIPVATPPLYTPYYCPCPLGGVSTLKSPSFTSPHLPSLPSLPASLCPPPPVLPSPALSLPELYSVPVPLVSSSTQALASGPLIGLMLPCPIRPESSAVFQAESYNPANFSTTCEDHMISRSFSTSLTISQGEKAMIELVPGVLSSNSLSRVISFCPDRVATSCARFVEVAPAIIPLAPEEPCSSSRSEPSVLNDLQMNDVDKRTQ